MAESIEKRVTIRVGAAYTGSAAMKSAVADVEKLRKQAELPVMGPLTREQSAIEAGLKQRVASMERAAERMRVKEKVEEILFGKGGNVAGSKQATALGKVAEEAKKAVGPMGHLLEIVRKFGTSNGTDTMFEKLTKIAPAVGFALAGVKAGSVALSTLNRISDTRRHNAQGNLERQLADEQGWNETASTMSLGFGPAFAERINSRGVSSAYGLTPGAFAPKSGYRDDKIAIENLEDQTKAQDRVTQRMEARAKAGKALRESSLADSLALRNEFAATTAEYGEFLKYAEKFRHLQEQIRNAGGKGTAETDEYGALLRQGGIGSLLSDGLGRLGRFAGGYANRAGAFLGRISDRVTSTRDIDAAIRQRRLRDEGRNFEADYGAVRAETASRVFDNPANAAMIREEQAAKESSIARKYHRELLDERRDFQRKMEGVDASAAERRLRLSGKAYEADKLQLANSFQSQAAEIKDRYEALIRGNPSEAPTFRRRAAQEMKAAGEGYSLGMAELMRERGMRFLAGGIATSGGALSTGAAGRGDIAAARERDVSQQQLRAVQDQARAIKDLPKAIADKFKEMLQSLGLGELGTSSEYK